MSGASLAVLSFGVPSFARVASAGPAHPAFVGASTAVAVGGDLILLDLDDATNAVDGSSSGPLRSPEGDSLPPLIGTVEHTGEFSIGAHNSATNSERVRTSRTNSGSRAVAFEQLAGFTTTASNKLNNG